MSTTDKKIVTFDNLQRYHQTVKSKLDEKLNKSGDELFEGNLTIQGNLYIQGNTTTVNQETLTVNDNIIVTNAHGSDAAPYTGVVAVTGNVVKAAMPGRYIINRNATNQLNGAGAVIDCDITFMGENYTSIFITQDSISFNDYGSGKPSLWLYQGGWAIDTSNQYVQLNSPIVFTQNAIIYEWELLLKALLPELEIQEREEAYATAVYNTSQNEIQLGLGYITRDNQDKVEFTFGGNENQAVATRSDSIPNGHLIKWDASSKKLVDGGTCTPASSVDQEFFNSLY